MLADMADNETPEQPEEITPVADPTTETEAVAAAPAPVAPAVPAAPAAPRLRDHVFSFRSVIAVGVATLLIGGAGGAALVAVTSDDHDDQVRISRFGDRPGRDGNGPQFQYGPDGGRGFAPPNAPEGGTQPDSGSNG